VTHLGWDHILFACDWGTDVWLPDDRRVCSAAATQKIKLHGPAQPVVVQVCDEHARRLFTLTVPHDVGSG